MKKYIVFDIVFDFVGCSVECSQELDQLQANFECSNGSYISWDSVDLIPDYPNLAAFIKEKVGNDPDPVLISIWW